MPTEWMKRHVSKAPFLSEIETELCRYIKETENSLEAQLCLSAALVRWLLEQKSEERTLSNSLISPIQHSIEGYFRQKILPQIQDFVPPGEVASLVSDLLVWSASSVQHDSNVELLQSDFADVKE